MLNCSGARQLGAADLLRVLEQLSPSPPSPPSPPASDSKGGARLEVGTWRVVLLLLDELLQRESARLAPPSSRPYLSRPVFTRLRARLHPSLLVLH